MQLIDKMIKDLDEAKRLAKLSMSLARIAGYQANSLIGIKIGLEEWKCSTK